jgi:hypothetical protein
MDWANIYHNLVPMADDLVSFSLNAHNLSALALSEAYEAGRETRHSRK